MHFDRFDICNAYYLFAILYHEGQSSKTYEIFGRLDRMGYNPSPLLSFDPIMLNDNEREIFDNLIKRDQS